MTDEAEYFPIVLNSSNLISDVFNNRFRYIFPQNVEFKKHSKVSLSSVNIYYSWFNITAQNQNNSFSFIWNDGAGANTFNVLIPDGSYSPEQLNQFLQQYFITNGLYLIDSGGNYVYYLEILSNETYYSLQVNSYPLPTVLPAGWSLGSGVVLPGVATQPQLIIPNTSITNYFGFVAGTYPTVPGATTQSFLSTFTPQVSSIQSIIVTCSLLNNRLSIPNNVLFSFSPAGVDFGNIINVAPSQLQFVNIQQGVYNEINVEFIDQNFNKIKINDTNLIIQLLFKLSPD